MQEPFKFDFQNIRINNDIPGLTVAGEFQPAFMKYAISTCDTIASPWTAFIEANYHELSDYFAKHGLKFIFLRNFLFDKDNRFSQEPIFNIQDSKKDQKNSYDRLNTENSLLSHIVNGLVNYQGLTFYWGYDDDFFYFSSCQFPYTFKDVDNEDKQWEIIKMYVEELNRHTANGFDKNEFIDRAREGLIETSIKKLNYAIGALREFGIPRAVINQALIYSRVLSHLVITNDNRILLPFFNIEIKMAPLPKSVYFLFLKHPEGILLKNMSDYREELYNIYLSISPAENLDNIKKSIDKLCNLLNNSINEKCSRIREAFLKHFEEELASIYFIVGSAGEIRTICFEREFVHWNVKWRVDKPEIDGYYYPIITRPQALQNLLKNFH